ncbi:lazarillo protein-like [Bradysia coprophila]|uniref:lazarillo protein-like n=1 Tax=Bradysia coprophila TaxID=38358 RepID=UPI00187DA7B6|nr:lazarillo protein-like [Bradysia coprophila]
MSFSYSVFVWAFAIAILSTDANTIEKPRTSCREPVIFQNFNLTRVLGQWYMYSHHNHHFERGCDCFTSEAVETEPNILQLSNCCQLSTVTNETQTCNVGVTGARLPNPEKKEAFFLFTRAGVSVESQLWIIDTDYDNYLIVNGCDHASDAEEHELFWIYSRDKEIDSTEMKIINDVLKAHNFERSKIIRHRHEADICRSRRPQRGNEHGQSNDGQGHGNSSDDSNDDSQDN